MRMSVLLTCMCVCHAHVWCPKRSERGVRSPSTEVTMVMNYTTDAGNWTLSSARATSRPQPPSPSLLVSASSSEVKDAVTHKVKHGLCSATCTQHPQRTRQLLGFAVLQVAWMWQTALQQDSWGRFQRVGAQDLTSLFFPGFPFSVGI